MWGQFFLENAHFAINIFAALVLFAVFWLYVDAWRERKTVKEAVRIIGFLLLSLSFAIHAATIESSIVAVPLLGAVTNDMLLGVVRLAAYAFLIASLLIEPLVAKPKAAAVAPFVGFSHLLYPVLSVTVGLLYLRRATVGLEDHVKTIAYSFFLLSVSEFLGLAVLFRESTNVAIFEFVAPFGPVWMVEHVLILVMSLMLGRWVFGYLLKQFHTQLFIIMTTMTIVIFLITTVSFTALLLKNIQDETLRQMNTDVHVLQYTIESQKQALVSDAQVLAQNAEIVVATRDKIRSVLSEYTQDFLLTKKENTVIITGENGQVLARGEDRDRIGDSLSDDPLIKRALLGETVTSVVSKDGAVSPQIFVRASTPIKDGETIVGAVLVGTAIDSAFVDGMKAATGLESSIYGDAQISATTLLAPDGVNRMIGIQLDRPDIKDAVLTNGREYTGAVTIANTSYFGAYVPLIDIDGGNVGMLFVGRPQASVLATAGRSIELTFLVTVVLMLVSVVPAYVISKYIADQIS